MKLLNIPLGCRNTATEWLGISPASDETTSHSTKLAKDASQVVGYPPPGERDEVSLYDVRVNE